MRQDLANPAATTIFVITSPANFWWRIKWRLAPRWSIPIVTKSGFPGLNASHLRVRFYRNALGQPHCFQITQYLQKPAFTPIELEPEIPMRFDIFCLALEDSA